MDDNDFKDLYKRHVRKLRACVINRFHIPEPEADDIVQEIFLKFWRKFEIHSAKYCETTLLHQIKRNIIGDYWRKNHPEHTINLNWDENEEGNVSAIEEAICHEIFQQKSYGLELVMCLKKVFAQLEAHQSNPYLLNCLRVIKLVVLGYSIETIATTLNRTPGATRKYMSECRKRLRQHPLIKECWEQRNR